MIYWCTALCFVLSNEAIAFLGMDERSVADLLPEIQRGYHLQRDVPDFLPPGEDLYKTPHRQVPNLRLSELSPGHHEDFEFRGTR
jgi:hypothetical protein